jgi:hypothetical protein
MTVITVRPAHGEDDIRTVAEMWVRAAKRLADQGHDQWQYPVKMHNIRAAVAAGTCWLVNDPAGKTAGTITVDDHADPNLWLPRDNPTDALYLHRMISENGLAGMEAGSALMDWAAGRATSQSKHWIRLDAWRTNRDLWSYYRCRGFELVRVVEDPTGSGACLQRPAYVQLGVGPTVMECGGQ